MKKYLFLFLTFVALHGLAQRTVIRRDPSRLKSYTIVLDSALVFPQFSVVGNKSVFILEETQSKMLASDISDYKSCQILLGTYIEKDSVSRVQDSLNTKKIERLEEYNALLNSKVGELYGIVDLERSKAREADRLKNEYRDNHQSQSATIALYEKVLKKKKVANVFLTIGCVVLPVAATFLTIAVLK